MEGDGLFSDDKGVSSIPLPQGEDTAHLASSGDIAREVNKEYVGTAIIGEVSEIKFPMILIRVDKVKVTYQFVISALRSLIDSSNVGNNVGEKVPVYMMNSGGLVQIGEGGFNKLYFSLGSYVNSTFGPKSSVLYYTSADKKQGIGQDSSHLILDI